MREYDGQACYEISVSGGYQGSVPGEEAGPLSFQTPLRLDEVRLLLGGGTVIRPDPPTGGAVSYPNAAYAPDQAVPDRNFESAFCRAALAASGLSRVVALAE